MDLSPGAIMKLAGLAVLVLPLVAAGRPAAAPAPAKPQRLADALLAGLGSGREPGAGILVRKDGQVVYLGVHGVADLQAMRPIDGRTAFRLASVTKAFTAAAVML